MAGDPPLYHRAPDGVTYRVHDVVYGHPPATPGTWRVLPLGDPRATSRVFVGPEPVIADGVPLYRSHRLGEARDTDPATLDAQWRSCGWWDARPLAEIMRRDLTGVGRVGG